MGCMRNSGTICPVTKPSPGVALFKGLGNNEIHMIRAAAAKRTFQASQIIIRAEEHAVRLFVIEVGSLDIFSGQAITLRSLGFGATIDSRMEP
jgi:signal-transduction protein with cAMP-binding, CBS, and nucleotidyltransferase domain